MLAGSPEQNKKTDFRLWPKGRFPVKSEVIAEDSRI